MKQILFNRHQNERGVALILTLSILVLVTLLVVSFAISMRVENSASRAQSDAVKAREFAMAGVNEAISQLQVATPPINAGTNYITSPGLIRWRISGIASNVPLYTTDGTNAVVDINLAYRGLINRVANRRMYVSWHNWTLTNSIPWIYGAYATTKPAVLIGRYAYWVDDEATKVNINAACQRTDPLGPTPKELHLEAITNGIDAAASYSRPSSGRPYPSVNSWALSAIGQNNITSGMAYTNHFNLTAHSADLRLNPWGTPCVNLNTNITAGFAAKWNLMNAITNAMGNMALTNWFRGAGYGQTFRQKYGGNVLQIAANIVDYIDLDDEPTDDPTRPDPPHYLGLERTPYLNELVISNWFRITTNGIPPNVWLVIETKSTTIAELWYMYPPPATDYALAGSIEIRNRPSIVYPGGANLTFGSPATVPASATFPAQPWSGTYRLFFDSEYSLTTSNMSSLPQDVTFNSGTITAVLRQGPSRLDYAMIRMTNHIFQITATMIGRTSNVLWISACKDPRVRPISKYWNPVGGGSGSQSFRNSTLGRWNSGTILSYTMTNSPPVVGPTVSLISDRDISCHTNIANRGWMVSLGELGYIHTGIPWRTLQLSAQDTFEKTAPNPPDLIPDWVVLDLFATTNRPVTGRININAEVHAYTNVDDMVTVDYPQHYAATVQRRNALRTLFQPPVVAALSTATGLAHNVALRNWTNSMGVYTPPTYWAPFTNCYAMIGQICEVRSLSDNFVSGNKAVRETRIRGIANLITNRSNTFSIWTVGQAIADANKDGAFNPDEGDRVCGEVVCHAVVERYEDPAATLANRVKFRIKYIHYYAN